MDELVALTSFGLRKFRTNTRAGNGELLLSLTVLYLFFFLSGRFLTSGFGGTYESLKLPVEYDVHVHYSRKRDCTLARFSEMSGIHKRLGNTILVGQ